MSTPSFHSIHFMLFKFVRPTCHENGDIGISEHSLTLKRKFGLKIK